jgi:SET domain-containing protein
MNTFPCPRYDLQQSEIFYADNKNRKQHHFVSGYIYTDEWPHGLVLIHDPEDVLNATQAATEVQVAFEEEPSMGTGVKTLARVKKGAFIGFVFGEIITTRRCGFRKREENVYDMRWPVLPGSSAYWEYKLDTTVYTSTLAFINHSCDPNAKLFTMVYNNMPVLAVFAERNIPAGGFIHCDYWSQDPAENQLGFDRSGCRCNSPLCRFPATNQ